MAAPAANQQRLPDVIDLVNNDSDTDGGAAEPPPRSATAVPVESDGDSEMYHTPTSDDAMPPADWLKNPFPDDIVPAPSNRTQGGELIIIDGEEVWIPEDEPGVPDEAAVAGAAAAAAAAEVADDEDRAERDREIALALEDEQNKQNPQGEVVTADGCLQRVLEIFPDISHEYVVNLYTDFDHEGDYEKLPGQARLDNIIEQLVSATGYPKQQKGKQALKRKRGDSLDESDCKKWERRDRVAPPNFAKAAMQDILKAEFPEIPKQYINETLVAQRHLYQAYVALEKTKDNDDSSSRPYGKGRPSTKHIGDATIIAANSHWPELSEELTAARQRVQAMRTERAAEEAKKQAEQENLQTAIANGETAECSACFDDLPMNRQIHCNGDVTHFTCFDCALTYIKSEIGESRCRVMCPAHCSAGFAHHQLNLLSDKQLLDKLAQLQQEKDIRDAGLDDLEECPFCEYKAILPPIEEDFEFRCANPECEKVSCRRCKAVSHIPMSCEQYAKDDKLNSRHKIEEAMTAALVRQCNKCKKQFIKEYGCNKMTCPSCGNLQCYVCSAYLKDYNHFDQGAPRGPGAAPSKLCPLYDNVEERHEREVKEAEAVARAEVVSENPDVTVEDLEIKVSDAVKKSTADRVRRAGVPGGGAAYGAYHLPFVGRRIFGDPLADDDDDDDDDDEHERQNAEFHLLNRLPVGRNPPGPVRVAGRAIQGVREHLDAEINRRRLHNRQAQRLYNANVMNAAANAAPPLPPAPGPMQGYIPVFGLQQQAPQAPLIRGPPPANYPAPPQPYNPPPFGGFNFFDDIFGGGLNFGGDGALDNNRPPALQPQQWNYQPPVANLNLNPNPVPTFRDQNMMAGVYPFGQPNPAPQTPALATMPGAFPGAMEAFEQMRQEQQPNLQQLREQHRQRLQQRQQERQLWFEQLNQAQEHRAAQLRNRLQGPGRHGPH